jgi:hypothetical protein
VKRKEAQNSPIGRPDGQRTWTQKPVVARYVTARGKGSDYTRSKCPFVGVPRIKQIIWNVPDGIGPGDGAGVRVNSRLTSGIAYGRSEYQIVPTRKAERQNRLKGKGCAVLLVSIAKVPVKRPVLEFEVERRVWTAGVGEILCDIINIRADLRQCRIGEYRNDPARIYRCIIKYLSEIKLARGNWVCAAPPVSQLSVFLYITPSFMIRLMEGTP